MKKFTFFIFTERGGISIRECFLIIIKVFLFSLSFTYRENSEIKVTVELTGSTVLYKYVMFHRMLHHTSSIIE